MHTISLRDGQLLTAPMTNESLSADATTTFLAKKKKKKKIKIKKKRTQENLRAFRTA